jgi:predicted DNA-binding transcriptional regulator AlpA
MPVSKPAASHDELLTIAEVLAELQVARSTFDTWRSVGSAPECIKLPNGQIRIRRRALEAWLASRTELADAS